MTKAHAERAVRYSCIRDYQPNGEKQRNGANEFKRLGREGERWNSRVVTGPCAERLIGLCGRWT